MHRSSEANLYARSAARLATQFYANLDEVGQFEPVTIDQMPADCRTLLAHHDHMTVMLEAFHDSHVGVEVLAERQDDASYARNSLITRQSDGAVVQFGIMQIWLADLPEVAQEQIADKEMPLGRILLRHNVFREVDVMTLWQVTPGAIIRRHVPGVGDGPIYGRSAQILVDDRPTVQLLEIVTLPE